MGKCRPAGALRLETRSLSVPEAQVRIDRNHVDVVRRDIRHLADFGHRDFSDLREQLGGHAFVRASALRFGDKRVQALLAVLVVFSLQRRGFNNREMRVLLAQLLGIDPAIYSIGRMTYDLRRLRLHGIIERIPHSHRYQLTTDGLRIACSSPGPMRASCAPNSPRS